MPEQRSSTVQVVVVDRRRLVREGVCAALGRDPELRARGVAALSDAGAADVLVLGGPPTDVPLAAPVVYLDESTEMHSLPEVVRAAATHPVQARTPDAGRSDVLTPREQMVLHLVGGGGSAAEIGRALGISPRTVERHKQSLVAKLGARNHANAVARSTADGMLGEVG